MSIPILWPDDTARTRSTDVLTSHEAADSNTNRALVEAFVLGLFVEFGAMTDAELTERYFADPAHPEAHRDSPRKRRSDLKDRKVLADVGTRPGPTGRRMTAWAVAHPFPPVSAKDVA